MMKRNLALVLSLALPMALSAACSKKKDDSKAAGSEAAKGDSPSDSKGGADSPAGKTAEAPSTPGAAMAASDVMSHFPADTEVVIGISMGSITKSPLWTQYSALAMASVSKELADVKAGCGFDPIAALQGVYVGINSDKSDDPVVIVQGFERKQLESCFEVMAKKDGETVELTQDGPITIVKSSDEDDEQGIAWINSNTMIMVPKLSDKAFLSGLIAGKSGLGDNAAFTAAASAANQSAPLWFAGAFRDGSSASKDLGKMTGSKPLAIYGALGFSEGLQVDLGVRFGTADEATKLVEKVKPLMGMAKGQMGPAGGLVDKVQIAAKDSDMTIKLNLSNADLEQLQQLAGPMLGGMGK